MADSDILLIKERINIADLISEYLKLTPTGVGVFKGLCPFHNEKTPSFMVSADRGTFHCFGCGAGGDIFEFLMRYESIDFPEALKILATKAGVTLSRSNKNSDNNKNRLYDICALTAKYWHVVLLESSRAQVARDYLNNRGLSQSTIEDFSIGYAIDDWQNLFDFLIKKGFSANEIFSAGLCIKKERGSGYYDRFRNRVMFPILDHNGRTCGFTGRTLDVSEPAKYINTPQTEIYNKSNIVFALAQAKSEIKNKDAVIIVEGQMDAVSSHQYGFKNTVASSGTALTKEQIKILTRYTNNIFFALDADSAGQKATDRGEALLNDLNKKIISTQDHSGRVTQFIDPFFSYNFNLKIIIIPEGKDPDAFLKAFGADAWQQALSQAVPVMEYFWHYIINNQDISDIQVKKKAGAFLAEKISKIDDPIESDYWSHEISARLGIREEAFRELLMRIKNNNQSKIGVEKNHSSQLTQDSQEVVKLEEKLLLQLLAIIWIKPTFLLNLAEVLLPDFFLDNELIALYKDLILFYTKNNDLLQPSKLAEESYSVFDVFYDYCSKLDTINQNELGLLEKSHLLAHKDFAGLSEIDLRYSFENIIRLLKSNYLNVKIPAIKSAIEKAETLNDSAEAGRLLEQLNLLIKMKSGL